MANRKKEHSRGTQRHGSCGLGIGEVVNAANHGYELTVGELVHGRLKDILDKCVLIKNFLEDQSPRTFIEDAKKILAWDMKTTWADYDIEVKDFIRLAAPFRHAAQVAEFTQVDIERYGQVVFEGAQGILIDEVFGEAPYHTWSNCTTGNAEKLCASWGLEPYRLGVTRTYMVRHGAGPLPTEHSMDYQPTEHNKWGSFQGNVRYGYLDLNLLRYAAACNGGVDGLAVTWLDAPPNVIQTQRIREDIANVFRAPARQAIERHPSSMIALDHISEAVNAPLILTSYRPGS